MLNSIRKFSKTFFAKIILIIMIIPFILWGMGGVFNTGNTNNIAKINNKNISTQDFMDFVNNSYIDSQAIRDNLDNNVLEELLSNLVSKKLLEMEIKDLNLIISENSLAKNIKKNPEFQDENNKFSRTKYEKFLLTQNTSAAEFEMRLKNNELQKKLFYYVGGGIEIPFFITNKIFNEEVSKIDLEYINLDKAYLKKNNITDDDVKKFINENTEKLKEEYIDFSYIKITPQNLIGSSEYNKVFFNKIDEIENEILNGKEIKYIANNYNLKLINKKNYIKNSKSNNIEKKIYEQKEEKIQLFDDGNFYVLYQINKVNKILPQNTNEEFKSKIVKILHEKNKYEYNKKIINQINENKFTQKNFEDLSVKNSIKIENITLNSIEDNDKFTENSVKLIYSLPEKSFALVNNESDNIYLINIIKINSKNILKNSNEFKNFKNKGKMNLRNQIYSSYDDSLNKKYKVKINQKTLERVKNYFK